jgi:kynurenine formamidase
MRDQPDDIGALHRIGRPERLRALSLARTGAVYDLGCPIDEGMPPGPAEAFPRFARAFCATPGRQAGPFDYTAEVIFSPLHTSTHIDAFVHVQRDGRIYGGARDADVRGDRGFSHHGAETIPPIVARAVVLDVAGAHGVAVLADGYEITVDDCAHALARAGAAIAPGDVVLVRTGKLRDARMDPDRFHEAAPGVGCDAAIWLYDQGMAALGSDTAGTDPAPFPDPARTTHVAMLVERGVHLIENVALDTPCADGVYEGLFVCLPLPITGATGSWVRPILVV